MEKDRIFMTELEPQDKQKLAEPFTEGLMEFMAEAKAVEFLRMHEETAKKNMEDLMRFMRT